MGYYPPGKVANSMSIRPAPYPALPLPEGAREAFLKAMRKQPQDESAECDGRAVTHE